MKQRIDDSPAAGAGRGRGSSLTRQDMSEEYDSPEFFVTTDQARFDFGFVCRSLHTTHWAKDRPDAVIVESFRNSLCFGLFAKATGAQIGFARVVTDHAVSSIIDDVFIDERYRRNGLGKWLMSCVVSHPSVFRTKSRLATADAHSFYEKFGYSREEVMRRRPLDPAIWPNKSPTPCASQTNHG